MIITGVVSIIMKSAIIIRRPGIRPYRRSYVLIVVDVAEQQHRGRI